MLTESVGKLKVFLCILGGIILLHVVILTCVVKSSGAPETEPPKEKNNAGEKTEKKTAASPKAEKKGLFSWFGGSKKTTAPAPEVQSPSPPPKPVYKYRKLSEDPGFGRALDYSKARRGTMPAHLIPGDRSTAAILVDMKTRKVLWEKNSHQMVPIASMSKMMTILLTMEHVEKSPQLSLSTVIPISKDVLHLPSREGIVWLDPRERFPLSDLIKCTAIKSANDAALQLALLVSGSEADFVARMNEKARFLGMADTRFVNAHGLPTKQKKHSLSSAHDMVLLGERLLEYPQIMTYFVTPSTTIREGNKKTVIRNTNKLIYKTYSSAEGMKTGFTRKAGFCLTFSVVRNGRRLMGCVTGFPTSRERDRFCKNLIDWAFAGCPNKAVNLKTAKTAQKKKVTRAVRPVQKRTTVKH